MAIPAPLLQRAQNQCELCTSPNELQTYDVTSPNTPQDGAIVVCGQCSEQLHRGIFDLTTHWRCLSDSMWSPVPAVQVLAWRILTRLKAQTWAQDCLDMLYLDDDLLTWAKDGWDQDAKQATVDSNGALLQQGDAVTLTKDLDVKGTNFTAKRGTVVRGIALTDNPEHIEGKVNGTRIVILTCFVKKSN